MKLRDTLRHLCLGVFTVSLIAGLVAADWYLRHSPVRQARRLLEKQGIEVSAASAVKASREGRIFILEQLEMARVDLGDVDDESLTPLLAAIRESQIKSIDFLLLRESVLARLDLKAGDTGLNAPATALRKGDFGLAERLLRMGANPDVVDEEGDPMHLSAYRNGNDRVFEFLLAAGADPDGRDEKGLTILVEAIDRQDGAAIHDLIAAGADIEVSGFTGERLLHEAVDRGDDEIADRLLHEGAVPDEVGVAGVTPLAAAVQAGDLEMVEILLAHGADPNYRHDDERSPLSVAVGKRDTAMMQRLIEYGADAEEPGLVLRSFRNRDLPALQLLLDSGAQPEVLTEAGLRILDLAVADGAVHSLRALLRAGADAEGKLWSALRSGDDEIAELVLLHGAKVSEIDRLGGHPLDYALREGRRATVELLLEAGADPNRQHNEKETWLATAIRTGDWELAEALLDRGADVEGVTSADGHTLLGWAIAWKRTELAKKLIELGADVRAREPSPAGTEFRERFERSKTFRWHLQADGQINPLMMAAAQGSREIARALMDAGAKRGEHSRRYLWPVNIAAWHADVPMMQIILGRDPDPDAQPRKLIINLSKQRVTLYSNGQAIYSSRVSTGKKGYRTKTGSFVISDKHRHHKSTLYDAQMPYFMRLSCGDFGLHEGPVPNYPASHGCIRVPHTGAKHLFYKCEVGDLVEITY